MNFHLSKGVKKNLKSLLVFTLHAARFSGRSPTTTRGCGWCEPGLENEGPGTPCPRWSRQSGAAVALGTLYGCSTTRRHGWGNPAAWTGLLPASRSRRGTAGSPARAAARPAVGIPGLGRIVPSRLPPRPCPAPLLNSPRCKITSDHLRK